MTSQADGVGVINLLASYAQTCDDDRFDEFEALFVDDAVMVVAGTTLTGANAIRTFVQEQQEAGLRGKHLIGNVLAAIDGEFAEVSSDFFFFQWIDRRLQVARCGRYLDVLRLERGAWRFVRHEVTFMPRATATPAVAAT